MANRHMANWSMEKRRIPIPICYTSVLSEYSHDSSSLYQAYLMSGMTVTASHYPDGAGCLSTTLENLK